VSGLDLERMVYRAVNGGDADLELMREALRVRALPRHGPRSWWRDRLTFLGSALVTTLRFARADLPPISSPHVVYTPGAGNKGTRDARAFFLRHHFGIEADFLGREARRAPRGKPGLGWMAWWCRGVGWALLGFFDWSERRYAWLGGCLVDMLLFKRLERELQRVFVFALYDRRQYFLTTFLARHTRSSVTAVYQNIPLARNCRHLHVPVAVVLTSRVNLAEADYYRAQGIFRPAAVTYASQEFAVETHDLPPSKPLFDIGYYSSGEWARREGLYQFEDVADVRRGAFLGNPYERAAAEHLAVLAGYAREHRRTLRIYLHPLERRLLNEHGLEPPYATLADGELVTLDTAEGSSRRTLYDARVAVSLQSSFIWERLDAGLDDSFIYEFPDPAMNVFERAALGPYARNAFRSPEELLEKIDRALRRA
jgi:hypothetical protein